MSVTFITDKDPILRYDHQTLTEKQQTQARENIGADFSYFGYNYSKAVATYDLSADGSSVKMHLFPHDGGYAAVVAGSGAMKNHSLTLHNKGYKVMTETREYADYIKKINKVCIEKGVTTIGDYFMFGAHYLKDVVFEDSSAIKRLGKYCFAVTQISGDYKFLKLEMDTEYPYRYWERDADGNLPLDEAGNIVYKVLSKQVTGALLDHSFFCCPKLQGITVGVDGAENRNIALSELAFFGCINLRNFKVADQSNTDVVLGRACFEYCTNLELMELEVNNTSTEGFNFLIAPVTSTRVKRLINASKGESTRLPLTSVRVQQWAVWLDVLSTIDSWYMDTNTSYKFYYCQQVASSYSGKHHEMMCYETDEQKKDEYLADVSTYATFWGKVYDEETHDWYAFRAPYFGSCWLFAYYHIWNVLHPQKLYNTIHDFVAMLQETKITVDDDLVTGLSSWDFKDLVISAGKYASNYFTKANTDGIYATDLPVDKIYDDNITTEGEIGTASWGVRKVLGWTGERKTAGNAGSADYTAWANIKKSAIDSILAGKPVIFECVGYGGNDTTSTNYGGLHAVAGIGYDAKTDKFKVIDSTWGFPSDDVPMEYWAAFESLLEPSEESAVWVFSAFDSSAILTPA